MDKDICNILPENTEKRDEKKQGSKRENIVYCPENYPYLCGQNTKYGKNRKKNTFRCLQKEDDCNSENKNPEVYYSTKLDNLDSYINIQNEGKIEKIKCKDLSDKMGYTPPTRKKVNLFKQRRFSQANPPPPPMIPPPPSKSKITQQSPDRMIKGIVSPNSPEEMNKLENYIHTLELKIEECERNKENALFNLEKDFEESIEEKNREITELKRGMQKQFRYTDTQSNSRKDREIARLREENSELKDQIRYTDPSSNSRKDRDIARLRQENSELKDQIRYADPSSNSRKDKEIARLREENSELKNRISETDTFSEDNYKKILDSKQEEIKYYQDEIQGLKNTIFSKQGTISTKDSIEKIIEGEVINFIKTKGKMKSGTLKDGKGNLMPSHYKEYIMGNEKYGISREDKGVNIAYLIAPIDDKKPDGDHEIVGSRYIVPGGDYKFTKNKKYFEKKSKNKKTKKNIILNQ